MNWQEIGEIKASKPKEKILNLLSRGVFTPKDLSLKLEMHISTVSRTLSALVEKGYVICLNPQQRKGKLFSITEKGLSLYKEIQSLGG